MGYRQNENLNVEFYWRPIEDKKATEREGRLICNDVEYVKIQAPADRTTIVDKKATDEERVRFDWSYEQFEKGNATAVSGTRLEDWPHLSPSAVKMLKSYNIFTIEQLADLTDLALKELRIGGDDLREKAREFITSGRESATEKSLAADKAKMEETIQALADQVKDLQDAAKKQKLADKKFVDAETGKEFPTKAGRDRAVAYRVREAKKAETEFVEAV